MCYVALSDPSGQLRAQFFGKCSGRILETPQGTGGFGYDPLFEIVEYHQTFAQLGATVKSVLSHRGRAMRQLIPQLLQLCEFGAWSNV
jgi:XTP/dITP diphosphohydrolase